MTTPLMRFIPVITYALLAPTVRAALPASDSTRLQGLPQSEVNGALTLAPVVRIPRLVTVAPTGDASTPRGEPGDLIHAGLPPCDDGGLCNTGLTIVGDIEQTCPWNGSAGWISLAFPVQTDGQYVSAINLTHIVPTTGGHLLLTDDAGGVPATGDIRYYGCNAIGEGRVGPQKYVIDPPVQTGGTSWIIVAFEAGGSVDVGFSALPGTTGDMLGMGFANLGGECTCEAWTDLAEFGLGYCYCASVEVAFIPPAACCYPDGSCVDQYGCEESGGVFQGQWPLCSQVDCTPGACCFDDQSCTIDFDTSCANAGGVYQGPNTSCPTFGSCSEPIGACCYDECFQLVCVQTTQSDCEGNNFISDNQLYGGIFQGANTTCAQINNCIPTGSCCKLDGTCTDGVTASQCFYAKGLYNGDGSTCATSDCSEPFGACCNSETGECTFYVKESSCQGPTQLYGGHGSSCTGSFCRGACCCPEDCYENSDKAGCDADPNCEFGGIGSSCATFPCGVVGACCNTALGTCTDNVPPDQCGDLFGEVYAGDGTTCATSSCPGSCCLADGSCIAVNAGNECLALGGTYLGVGSLCEPDSCNGACCGLEDNCYETIEPGCANSCGQWHGVGTSCEDVLCPQLCDPHFNCPNGLASVFSAGSADNFCFFGDPAIPGSALTQTWANLGSCALPKGFDDPAVNKCFGHTLSGLPSNIVAATLTVHVRADGSDLLACNDSINLQANSTLNGFLWSNRLGNGGLACTPVSPNLLGAPWQFGEDQTFCLDLAALPTLSSPISLLPSMNSTGRLDVYIQDDTEVDYLELKLITCPPCDGDANDDASVDPLDAGYVLARFGCIVGTGESDCDSADTNTDGQVDPLDVGYVLARFGECQ